MSTPADTFLAAIADAAVDSAAEPSLESFMAKAITMEQETGRRYDELADIVQAHDRANPEVVELFRAMAGIERRHADMLLAQMGWTDAPPASVPAWNVGAGAAEGPEATASDELHYLMQPCDALKIALRNEERAERFFDLLAAVARSGPVREAALALEREERAHVALVKALIAKVPQPGAAWEVDPDPSRSAGVGPGPG
jgi:rubrerythrin